MDTLGTLAHLRARARPARAAHRGIGGQAGRPAGARPKRAPARSPNSTCPRQRCAGSGPRIAARLDADRRWLERSGAQLIGCSGSDFPPLLAAIDDAPACLFVRGDAACLLAAQLAMVGSRDPTASGRRDAAEFARYFARSGLVITSGLALGIDAASHEGALAAGGRTVAVLGSGLDSLYPPENAAPRRAHRAHGGALVSEFPPGTPPLQARTSRGATASSAASASVSWWSRPPGAAVR